MKEKQRLSSLKHLKHSAETVENGDNPFKITKKVRKNKYFFKAHPELLNEALKFSGDSVPVKVAPASHQSKEASVLKKESHCKLTTSENRRLTKNAEHKEKKKKKFKEKACENKVSKQTGESANEEKRVCDDQTFTTDYVAKSKGRRKIPVLEKMRERLNGSRFRQISETFYKQTGSESYEYFHANPGIFAQYHSGYERQVSKWPTDPLNFMIESIKKHSRREIVIADLGCGNARLAKKLPNYDVRSFDIVALDPCVQEADIAHLPLDNESVDICVFCLSLMGTNSGDYLIEAFRVLMLGGTMLIAELSSRLSTEKYTTKHFIRDVESIGFQCEKSLLNDAYFVYFVFCKNSKKLRRKKLKVFLRPCLYKIR